MQKFNGIIALSCFIIVTHEASWCLIMNRIKHAEVMPSTLVIRMISKLASKIQFRKPKKEMLAINWLTWLHRVIELYAYHLPPLFYLIYGFIEAAIRLAMAKHQTPNSFAIQCNAGFFLRVGEWHQFVYRDSSNLDVNQIMTNQAILFIYGMFARYAQTYQP